MEDILLRALEMCTQLQQQKSYWNPAFCFNFQAHSYKYARVAWLAAPKKWNRNCGRCPKTLMPNPFKQQQGPCRNSSINVERSLTVRLWRIDTEWKVKEFDTDQSFQHVLLRQFSCPLMKHSGLKAICSLKHVYNCNISDHCDEPFLRIEWTKNIS